MRGRTIASFGQAFPCWVDSSEPLILADSGTGTDAIASLTATLTMTDSGAGADSAAIVILNTSKRGLVTLGPRSFTIKGRYGP